MPDLNPTFGLIEDETTYREFLRNLIELQPGWRVVFACPDAGTAFKMLNTIQPDLILLDNNLPGISGLDAIPQIRTLAPNSNIMLLTVEDQAAKIVESLKLGANGYHIKGTSPEQTFNAISEMINRGASMDAAVARRIIAAYRQNVPVGANDILTARQEEILRLVAKGKQRGEIAAILGVSLNTIKKHLRNIFDRLGARTQIEAVNKFSNLQPKSENPVPQEDEPFT